jgi:hypothetical protein
MKIKTAISVGELLDKISILKIKSKKITNKEKLLNISIELSELMSVCNEELSSYKNCNEMIDELEFINTELWEIEDEIRKQENKKDFNEKFIALARSVYITNDKRFDIKNKINQECGSIIKEEKSYEQYQ